MAELGKKVSVPSCIADGFVMILGFFLYKLIMHVHVTWILWTFFGNTVDLSL